MIRLLLQDQIVACLCEFVEANRTEICSGWRPLFGTLRVANGKNNAAAILEVFRIFLSTDNTLVFANAALDYILCLLSHIRNANGDETSEASSPAAQEKKEVALFEKEVEFSAKGGAQLDLCSESLKLLQSCAAILSVMYNMPKCPNFNLTHRINIDTEPQLVDPVIQNTEIVSFNQEASSLLNYKVLAMKQEMELCEKDKITLQALDRPSGVLKIWYILLEGLSSASIISAHKNQPVILDSLFKLLRELIENPGVNFGLICINHLLLPMVQNWLRQNTKIQKSYDIWHNFKHCCGLASELVVDYLHYLQAKNQTVYNDAAAEFKENPSATLALKQLLLILIECVAQPLENIARLGTSCIRHIVLSVGPILSANQWEILVTAMHRACAISLNPLHQLTLAFKQNSDSFYGDLATVKVAARKDTTVPESERLYELAKQVFLMQCQRHCNKCNDKSCDCDQNNGIVIDDRSYVFLLYPLDMSSVLNLDLYTVRVPFKSLVVGILAHQMLIQTISSALLQNLNHVTPILNILQINCCSLRGILSHVNAKHVDILLKCLEVSNVRAKEFDLRPGLKFLTQKVGNLNKAANLYTQANTSEVVQIIVLIELCLDGIEKHGISPKDLKEILAREDREKCSTDLDYVEMFLRKLQNKWEYLCESYTNLTISIPDNEDSSESDYKHSTESLAQSNATSKPEEKPRPFRLADFKRRESFSSSTDSESYLEKDILPNLKSDEDTVFEIEKTQEKKPQRLKQCCSFDETAIFNSKEDGAEKFKVSVKYDTNTMLQIKSTVSAENIPIPAKMRDWTKSESYDVDKDVEQKVEAMLEQYRKRKPLSPVTTSVPRMNPFISANALPPPQPVPPEIQQQRAMSIFKVSSCGLDDVYASVVLLQDSEAYKVTRIETMEACLELLGSLPPDRLSPLASVLKQGAVMLIGAQDDKIKAAAENLLQRMNISYIDVDNFDV